MDDQKLKSLINDSIQEVKDSFSKEISELRTLIQRVAALGSRIRPPIVEFKRFHGENPEAWISQAEQYFKYHGIIEAQKLSLASFYLDGEALRWYQWLFRNKQLDDWKHFTEKVRLRFRKQPGSPLSNTYFTTPKIASQLAGSKPEEICHVTSVSKEIAHQLFDRNSHRNCQVFSPCDTELDAKSSSRDNVLDEMLDRANDVVKHSRLEPCATDLTFGLNNESFVATTEHAALTQVQLLNESCQDVKSKDYQFASEMSKTNCFSKVSPTLILQKFPKVQSEFEVGKVDSCKWDNKIETEVKNVEVVVPLTKSVYAGDIDTANNSTSVECISTWHHFLSDHIGKDLSFDPGSHLLSRDGEDVETVDMRNTLIFHLSRGGVTRASICPWFDKVLHEFYVIIDDTSIVFDPGGSIFIVPDFSFPEPTGIALDICGILKLHNSFNNFVGQVLDIKWKGSTELLQGSHSVEVNYNNDDSISGQMDIDSLSYEKLYMVTDFEDIRVPVYCEKETGGNQVYIVSSEVDYIRVGGVNTEYGRKLLKVKGENILDTTLHCKIISVVLEQEIVWKIFVVANKGVNDTSKVQFVNYFAAIEDRTCFGLLLLPVDLFLSHAVIGAEGRFSNANVDMDSLAYISIVMTLVSPLQHYDCNSIATISQATNLEVKVPIDDGGIVMNVNSPSEGMDGILESYLWDPG